MQYSGLSYINSTFMDKIPQPYRNLFPLKSWERWELKFLNPDLEITQENMHNQISSSLSYFTGNYKPTFKNNLISATIQLNWAFTDVLTKEKIGYVYPSFNVDFYVDVIDGKQKQADNINMRVYNIKAI